MKIIYIITFPPKYEFINSPKPIMAFYNKSNEVVGIWKEDWGCIFGNFIKECYPHIEFEVWRQDYRADKEYFYIFENGLIYRSFPCKKIRYKHGLKYHQEYFSDEILKRLENLIDPKEKNKNLIIHIPIDFSYFTWVLLKNFSKKIPFLHTSHLNPELFKIKIFHINPLKLLHRFLIKRMYDKYLKNAGNLAVFEDRLEFFKSVTKSKVFQLDYLYIDFDYWYKQKVSKEEALSKLNIDEEKIILFSSSRLVPEKQIDKLIISLSNLSEKNFIFYISGTGESSYIKYLHNLVSSRNLRDCIKLIGYLSNDLIYYYCACDIFISSSSSEGGPVSGLIALALEKPVIATNTGMLFYLLKKFNSGVIIDKNNYKSWSKIINSYLDKSAIKKINTIKINDLTKNYNINKGINQLFDYYCKSIEYFK